MTNIIISIKPRHVLNIISGEKTIELRSRKVKIPVGTRIWIYSTLPFACITAFATAESIETGQPSYIWEKYSNKMKISYDEFKSYTKNKECVTAIALSCVHKINNPITSDLLKKHLGKFHPPQFFSYLSLNSPLLKLLNKFSNDRLSTKTDHGLSSAA